MSKCGPTRKRQSMLEPMGRAPVTNAWVLYAHLKTPICLDVRLLNNPVIPSHPIGEQPVDAA